MRNWHGNLSPFGSWHTSLRDSVAVFDPVTLFSVSDTGWVYDLSDMSTLFQDAAGTTPVTAVGQPVGLHLDKSKGLVLGPELVTNGTFDTDTSGWTQNTGGTLTWNAGRANIVSVAATSAYQALSVTAGKTYAISADIQATSHSGGGNNVSITVREGTAATSTSLQLVVSLTAVGSASGTVYYRAESTTTVYIHSRASSGGCTWFFDNISVKELPGNHRTQSTALNRPTYARHPLGGIRNLLTRTEEFNDAVWSGGTSTSVSGNTVAETATTSEHLFSTNITVTAGQTLTGFLDLQKGPGSSAPDIMQISCSNNWNPSGYANYNLVTGVVTGSGGGVTASMVDRGNGVWRCVITSVVSTSGSGGLSLTFVNNNPTAGRRPIYTGNVNANVSLFRAQLELGSTATAYQRVGSTFDVTEAGVEDLYYLSYDGVNDSLATASFAWGTDKATVVAGVRKLSDAATAVLLERSQSWTDNAGSFVFSAPADPAPNNFYRSSSRGNAAWFAGQGTSSTAFAAPDTAVISGLHDISGDSTIIRRNGTAFAAATGDKGTGNFLTYQTFFGSRAGTSFFFNGREYSNVGINRLLTTQELDDLEAWTAGKTGITL